MDEDTTGTANLADAQDLQAELEKLRAENESLKKQAALPILMDEGVVSPVELVEFIRLGMIDGLSMKPSRCGGLLSNKRQIDIIEEHVHV